MRSGSEGGLVRWPWLWAVGGLLSLALLVLMCLAVASGCSVETR
jgi:hypothetical protein